MSRSKLVRTVLILAALAMPGHETMASDELRQDLADTASEPQEPVKSAAIDPSAPLARGEDELKGMPSKPARPESHATNNNKPDPEIEIGIICNLIVRRAGNGCP